MENEIYEQFTDKLNDAAMHPSPEDVSIETFSFIIALYFAYYTDGSEESLKVNASAAYAQVIEEIDSIMNDFADIKDNMTEDDEQFMCDILTIAKDTYEDLFNLLSTNCTLTELKNKSIEVSKENALA